MTHTDLLLITPPFIQMNTVYPATPGLKGFLQEKGFNVAQLDLSIECLLKIFSSDGLKRLFHEVKHQKHSANSLKIMKLKERYLENIDAVISFLQNKDASFAQTIMGGILPEAGRFKMQKSLIENFDHEDIQSRAKFLATLFIEDLSDFITECVDNRFGLSRYAEQIGLNARSFDIIHQALKIDSPISDIMIDLLNKSIQKHQPKIIGFTIPFPGNLLMALKSAQFIKVNYPNIKIVIGGGFVNTEMRQLNEPKLFELVDFVCLDDGERPLEKLLDFVLNNKKSLLRTFMMVENQITYVNDESVKDYEHSEIGTPDYQGLTLSNYISVIETTNPMHNLWSNGRWNKMVLAHGCYWHRCAFCDVSLDYINRYSGTDSNVLCDRIESIIKQTNFNEFHFVDEAASPAVLRKLAEEIIFRKMKISWWTNIRFEKAFTPELCKLLAESGCIAVSGGIEVASDRLLQKMDKGVSIKQVVDATSAFQNSGIMIHAYLMYGFPTQTEQETIDSLEIVRQLFKNKLLQSAFWHRFAMTVHSPIGLNPEKYGVQKVPINENAFTQNGCNHIDRVGCNPLKYSSGLVKALYNYLHENGLNYHLQDWFEFKIPNTKIPKNYINCLKTGL